MVWRDVTFMCSSPDSSLFVEVGLASKTITAVPDFSSVITILVIKCCLASIDRFVNNTVFSFFIVVLPKYGRVNLLKSTFDNAVQMLFRVALHCTTGNMLYTSVKHAQLLKANL